MNPRTLLAIGFLSAALPALAQQSSIQAEAAMPKEALLDWDNPAWWEYQAARPDPGLALGKSDFRIRGPLVESFRLRAPRSDRTPLAKFTTLPIINLFIPQPMPLPPRSGGKYFAWGQRDLPWSVVADTPLVYPVDGARMSSEGILTSVNW